MHHGLWVMVRGAHHHGSCSCVSVGACHCGHLSPSLGVWWGAAHCPCVDWCGHLCISMCACCGGVLLTINGLVVGLILVYALWMVVVMCGWLLHSSLWAVVLWAHGCGGVHIVTSCLWVVVGFIVMGGCGMLVGGRSGCWLWLWVVIGLCCCWFVVIVAISCHLCLWALVVCCCRWSSLIAMWAVVVGHSVCCWWWW